MSPHGMWEAQSETGPVESRSSQPHEVQEAPPTTSPGGFYGNTREDTFRQERILNRTLLCYWNRTVKSAAAAQSPHHPLRSRPPEKNIFIYYPSLLIACFLKKFFKNKHKYLLGSAPISRLKATCRGKEVFNLVFIQGLFQASGDPAYDLGYKKAPPFNTPELSKVRLAGPGWAGFESFWLLMVLARRAHPCPASPCLQELPYSGATSNGTHPHGGLATMGLLQPEDLGHHVLRGGMQQDPPWGQAHHHISTHRGQAHRNGIGTWGPKEQRDISQSSCYYKEIIFPLSLFSFFPIFTFVWSFWGYFIGL